MVALQKNKTKRTRYGFWFLPPAPPRPNGLIMIPMFDKLHFAMKIIALWKLQNSREPNFVPFASADGLPDTHTHKQTKWEDNEHPFRWYSKTNLIMAAFRERGGRPPNGFTIAIFAVVCLVFFSFRPFQTMWWMERVCSPVFYLVERTGTEYLPPAPSTGAAIGNLMHDMGRALFHVMNTGETWNETDSIIRNSVKIK